MWQNIKENTMLLLTNRKFLIVIVVSAVLIAAALWVYTNYVAPKLQPSFVPNKEFIPKGDDVTHAELYFFCVDWCPHCKAAKPALTAVKDKYEKVKINGVQVVFHFVDGEKEEEKVTGFEKNYNVKIDGFPTIYLVKGEQVIEYDATPNESTLSEFLHTTL